jgi:CDP-diacylglycerol pyrophosphatase
MRKTWRGKLALALVVAGAAVCAAAANRAALWQIVHDECLAHAQAGQGPAPCAAVETGQGAAKGWAILKDRRGELQFLLIPTARMGGIESPELLAPGATNYFAEAWRARRFVNQRRGREVPRQAMSLTINAQDGRTQDQLHIHIDCVRADVRRRLRELPAEGAQWRSVRLPGWAGGREYRVKRVAGEELEVNPFALVAREAPGAREKMGEHSIAIVGAEPSGFYLLDTQGDHAHAEDLQDHEECVVE